MITKLLNRGANINYRNRYGKSPLLYAVEIEAEVRIIDLFVQKGANPHLEDDTGKDVC
jgi:ankyrin repeat protein